MQTSILTRYRVMEGWTMVTEPPRADPSQIRDHDEEVAQLLEELLHLHKRRLRAEMRGDTALADELRIKKRAMLPTFVYEARQFERMGGWNRYYMVHNGLLHRDMGCNTISSQTSAQLIPHLSGLPLSVVERTNSMCRRCIHFEPHDYTPAYYRQVRSKYGLIDN